MTGPNPLLLQEDFTKFQNKDPQWFLDAVASTITDYCGWHIAPVRSDLNVSVRLGGKGIGMLPSLNVVTVDAVRLNGILLDEAFYTVHTAGWIEMTGFVKPPRNCPLAVDFTHGFEETPKAVAEVGFELADTALEKASGIVTDLTRGPTVMKFKEFGVVLSDDQKNRLGPYTLRLA